MELDTSDNGTNWELGSALDHDDLQTQDDPTSKNFEHFGEPNAARIDGRNPSEQPTWSCNCDWRSKQLLSGQSCEPSRLETSTSFEHVNTSWSDWINTVDIEAPPPSLFEQTVSTPTIRSRSVTSPSTSLCESHSLGESRYVPLVSGGLQPEDSLLPPVVYKSTILIEYWFTEVCHKWSSAHYSRHWCLELARRTWSCSEPVYDALQAMAAFSLVEGLPKFKEEVPTLILKASQSIQQAFDTFDDDNCALRDHQNCVFPTRLYLAILTLGTSLSWVNPLDLGSSYLRLARMLFAKFYNTKCATERHFLSKDLQLYRQSLVHWEMLVDFVSTEPQSVLHIRRSRSRAALEHSIQMNSISNEGNNLLYSPDSLWCDVAAFQPNSWLELHKDSEQLFGIVVGLCRMRCLAKATSYSTAKSLCEALSDIHLAQSLEEELLDCSWIRNSTEIAESNEKAQAGSRADIQEAYRLGALLQLHLTFPDLENKTTQRSQDCFDTLHPRSIGNNFCQTSLAISLVDLLRKMLHRPGSECIALVLLISAAAGLKVNCRPQTILSMKSGCQVHKAHSIQNSASLANSVYPTTNPALFRPSLGFGSPSPFTDHCPGLAEEGSPLTSFNIEMMAARRSILTCFEALYRTLPTQPVRRANSLVQAMWADYDSDVGQTDDRHWIETMMEGGVRTLFG